MYGKEKGRGSLKSQIIAQAKAIGASIREEDPSQVRSHKKAPSLKDQIEAQRKARERAKVLALPEEFQEIARLFEVRVLGQEHFSDSFDARRKAVEEGFQATRHLWYPRKKGFQGNGEEAGHGAANVQRGGPVRIERISKKERDRARIEQAQTRLFPSEGPGPI